MIYPALVVGAICASSTAAIDPTSIAPAAIDARLSAVATAHGNSTRLETLATSAGGHPIRIITIGDPATIGKRLPTLLLVAGSDARHQTGIEVALRVAERFAASPPPWLAHASISILPCLNPDGLARSGPAADFGRLVIPTDADGDGRQIEDGGDDLDGDGMILAMRIKSPAPSTGLNATLCTDPDFPQLMRAPDPAKGELPVYAVLIEGLDNDGDGRFNEDGIAGSSGGGLDLDQQWPSFWPEFRDGSGRRPLQTDETLALAAWCQAHPQIASVVVFGRHETLVSIPEAGKMDPSGQVPIGIEGDDKPVYESISSKFKEITGINESPGSDTAGSLISWAYTNLGVPAFATPVWVRPDLVKEERRGITKPAGPDPSSTPDAKAPLTEAAPPTPPAKPRPEAKSDESKWLRYYEETKDQQGFVDWKPWKHPQLGEVEIGGFVPGARMNAPAKELPRLVEQQSEFLGDLASRFAVIEPRTWATRLGPGLWKIELRLTNTGKLPTRLAIGAKSRAKLPTIATLDVEPAKLMSGRKIVRAESIAANGGVFDASWTVRADDGTSLKMQLTDPMMEPMELVVPLTASTEAKP
ncbi:MAG: M14 family zinc carboxypeptidase [Planctomycetota bacterium]|nr:M14 family zinc carboxypeptidase [Planctomycetota bacterium]